MEIRRLLGAVKRKLWLIVLLVILGGGFTGYVSITGYVPMYNANTSLYIMNQNKAALTGESLSYNDLMVSKQFVQDYSELIHSRKVLSAVVRELNNQDITESMVDSAIEVYLQEDSNVMAISAEWTDPKTAAAIANSVSRTFISKLKDLTDSDNIGIVDEAVAPKNPEPSNNTKNILIGILAGLAIAFGIIYVRELFDTTIRSAEDIEKGLGFKVMGIIPEHDIH